MMKTIFYKATIFIVLIVTSCGKEKKGTTESSRDEKEEISISGTVDLDITDEQSDVVFTDEKVNLIYDQYLNVKKGLVNSNYEVVQQEAKKLSLSIKEEDATKQLKATAKLISLTKDVKKQRDFFVTLTAETEKLISQADITSGEIYKQFCPMAFDNTGGYWLSNSKEVRNPYFGNSMLKCGEVKETIQ